jgi:hypothetical protein
MVLVLLYAESVHFIALYRLILFTLFDAFPLECDKTAVFISEIVTNQETN